jgi:hypothetical protein
VKNLKQRNHFGDLGWKCDSSGSGKGPGVGSCKHSNEFIGFIKCGEFLDKLNYYSLLKKGSAEWSYLFIHELIHLFI